MSVHFDYLVRRGHEQVRQRWLRDVHEGRWPVPDRAATQDWDRSYEQGWR